MSNKTFTIIKPDAVEKGYIGAILEKITAAGFTITALKMTQMTIHEAQQFYAIHKSRPFFNELIASLTIDLEGVKPSRSSRLHSSTRSAFCNSAALASLIDSTHASLIIFI